MGRLLKLHWGKSEKWILRTRDADCGGLVHGGRRKSEREKQPEKNGGGKADDAREGKKLLFLRRHFLLTSFFFCGRAFLGKEAGAAFERAASIQTKNLNEPDDAANTLVEAFKAYRKTDPGDAARVLDQAIQHYTLKGNFRRAATYKQNLAELYEVELGDLKKALEAYDTAAGWYEADNAEA